MLTNQSTENHIHLILKGHHKLKHFKKCCKESFPNEVSALVQEGYIPRQGFYHVEVEDGRKYYYEVTKTGGEPYMWWEGYI